MSTYWAPAPSHHAYVTTVDGEAVSDYGAYVHESQTEDPEDTAAMDSLRKAQPVAQQVVSDGSSPTDPKPRTSRKRHPVLNPWRCRSHLHVDLPSGYVVTRDGLLAPKQIRGRAKSIRAALEKRAARDGQRVRY